MLTKFAGFYEKRITRVGKIDVVWDRYLPGTLKDSTGKKRGIGICNKVGSQVNIPSNWKACDSKNKEEMLDFLSDEVSTTVWPEFKGGYITTRTSVVCKGNCLMPECTHEEADTRVECTVSQMATEN